MKRGFIYLCLLIGFSFTSIGKAQKSSQPNMQELNKEIRNFCSHRDNSFKPLIGISAYHSKNRDSGAHNTYVNAIIKAGGIPVIIPLTTDMNALYDIVTRIDGLIMTGGDDVYPSYYNESPIEQLGAVDSIRDRYDLTLIKMSSDRMLPILGICRGIQLINVALGGTLYQDLPTQHPSGVVHSQKEPSDVGTHDIEVADGTLLSKMIGAGNFKVNSFHHQAVKKVAPGFRVSALSADSIVEAMETISERNIIAVQFHPECLILKDDTMLPVFRNLVQRSLAYHQAHAIPVMKERAISRKKKK
jgi:gamma-glutamyl-gamma-aminobutyrate hydrolase PuuD